jgi:hypothetical protein
MNQMLISEFYAPIETFIGRVRIYGSENPRDSRVMNEAELKARDQFVRLFGEMALDEDTHDELFRFVKKNIEHCDKLQPLKQRDLV